MVDGFLLRKVLSHKPCTHIRLCSSKLGHPIMINDDDIDAEMPSNDGLSPQDLEEFFDAENQIANIKLARISGEITNGSRSLVCANVGIYRIPKRGPGQKQA